MCKETVVGEEDREEYSEEFRNGMIIGAKVAHYLWRAGYEEDALCAIKDPDYCIKLARAMKLWEIAKR